MSPTELDQMLSTCVLFLDMTEAERAEIIPLLEVKTFDEGTPLVLEGPPDQTLWIVLKGRCQVAKRRKAGGEKELAVLLPLDVVGEMSFFHAAPHSANVRALEPVTACRLSHDQYALLQERGSCAANKLVANTVRILSERLRRMDDWAADFMERAAAPEHHEEWRDFRAKLYSGWKF